ncbi:RDD family protein [Colwellia sp. RE-S-Sl-9]
MNSINYNDFPRAGFRRRVACWVYDFLTAVAVYMVAGLISFCIFIFFNHLGFIDMGEYEHLIDVQENSFLYSSLIYLWNFFWVAFFFVWFWARSGQTIGMKAWRLRVQNQDGSLISKTTGIKRLLPTLMGLGNLAVIFDRKNKLSLQDRFTQTEVVLLPIEVSRAKNI